ncbi:MAG: L17 family ribosomal protein, partial [Planctomycetota bacterium]
RTLFGRIAPAAGDRAGGYTRIIRVGKSRLGDKAPLALFQLVDKPSAPVEQPEVPEVKKGKGGGKGEEKPKKVKAKKEKAAAAAQ